MIRACGETNPGNWMREIYGEEPGRLDVANLGGKKPWIRAKKNVKKSFWTG